MQSICPNCKSPVSPNDLVCKNCGYNLTSENTAALIVRLIPAAFLVLVFIGILVMLVYGNITYYLTTTGVITTPLFWRATSTITPTTTLTPTKTPRNTRTPTSTLTLIPSETSTSTSTITLTPSPIPSNTSTPSVTPSITPVPSKTKVPSVTPKPSATTKPISPTSTTVIYPTATNTTIILPSATTVIIPSATSTSIGSPTPTIGALSDPVQFLRAYYTMINNRIYETAWSWLTPNFIATKSLGLDHTFSFSIDYVPYWNTVSNVEVLQATVESITADNAQVLLQVRYTMIDGTKSLYQQRMFLIKSTVGPPWMIDGSDVIAY